MQKAVFLICKRGAKSWSELFDYEPYNWGPYSSSLTAAIRGLTNRGDLETRPFPGSAYGEHRTTPSGEQKAEAVWSQLAPQERQFVKAVKRYVTNTSFQKLLREVYAAFPDYASKSHFTG
ncbi:hypothetical protein [Nakamurella endophytica]|nr:hypothetical protein [Nakamurella endophytica]